MSACMKCRQSDSTEATLGLCPRCYGEACSTVPCPMEKRKCEACDGEGKVEGPVYSRGGRLVPDAGREVKCAGCDGDGEIEIEVCAGKGRPTCAPDGVTCPAREAARAMAEAYAREQVAAI